MIATETAKTVLFILLGLSILWIIVIIIRNDMQTIIRALIVAALLGVGLFYVSQTKLEKLSFAAIRDELFPVEAKNYSFEKREGSVGGLPTTTFVFDDPGPPLSLVMISGGKYMAIRDVRPVNVVLELLELPPVSKGVPELASITGRSLDTDKYRWDDYPAGVLLLERGICGDMATAKTFTCIARITLTPR